MTVDLAIEDADEEILRAVRQAREGDLRAFEQLVEQHQKRILADCRYLTRDENNSEDLAQEVFVKAFFAIKTFEGRSSFRHWLQRIKVHHCLNHIKKTKGKDALSLEEEGMEEFVQLRMPAVAHRDIEAEGDRRQIEIVLNAMPATLRIPLVMCDMDEMSYEEVAVALGIGLSAVKMRIKRARQHFRRLYAGEESIAAGQP